MTSFLISNLSDLFVKVISTYILLSFISTNAFWLGETLGKSLSSILSFILVFIIIKKTHLKERN